MGRAHILAEPAGPALALVDEPKARLLEIPDEPLDTGAAMARVCHTCGKGPATRLYATPFVHRLVPTALAVRLAEWDGRVGCRTGPTVRLWSKPPA